MKNIILFSGSSHPELSVAIAKRLGLPLGKVTLGSFSNGETSVEIGESVRDMDVYIIQTFIGPINNLFMELCILIHACKIASARKITAILPLFPYSKQPNGPYDKIPSVFIEHNAANHHKNQSNISNEYRSLSPLAAENSSSSHYKMWRSRNGKLISNLIMTSGANHIITLDLHDPQFQGFFNIPVDNLKAAPSLYKYIIESVRDWKNVTIVSPDAGGAKRAIAMAEMLGASFALIHKERKRKNGPDAYHHHSNSSLASIYGTTLESPQLFSHSKSPSSSCLLQHDDLERLPSSSPTSSLSPKNTSSFHGRTLVGDVKDRPVIIIDDMADTCNTLIKAASICQYHGASIIYAIVSHGIFSSNALEKLKSSPIHEIVITNSVPLNIHDQQILNKIKVIDIAPLFAESIRRIHYGESVSFLFDRVPL